MRTATKCLIGAAVAMLAAGAASAMVMQATQAAAETPRNWGYELRDGRRVERANRVTNSDGSWREEMRQGTCTTVKEKTANGDYTETRKCD